MNKKIFFYIFIILIIIGISFRFISLNKDFSAEETDFVNGAIAIANTGHPVFYNSELYPKMTFLHHPPTYIYLMSLFMTISQSEISARIINVIFSLLTAILIFMFCKNIIGGDKGKNIGFISVAFFLVNYYILSSSILIDIDALSMFAAFGFIYFILRNYQTQKNYYLVLAGIFLFFGIVNRYPIMILIYIFTGIYFFINMELRKNFKGYIFVGFLSSLSFLIIWGIYSTLIESGNFFSFLIHNINLGGEQFSSIKLYVGSFILNIAQFIRLLTFPAVILFICAVFYFIKKKSKLSNLLLLYVLPVLIFFIIVPRPAFGYPRYFMTTFPGISILIGTFIYLNLKNYEFEKKEFVFVIFIFLISLIFLTLLNPQATIYNSKGLIKATNFPDFAFNLLSLIPLIFVFLFKEDRKKIFMLIFIGLVLSYSIYFDIKLVINNNHTKETGEYIKINTNASEIIMAPKSIAYYAERKYHINANNKPKLDFSPQYIWKYIVKSLEDRTMTDEFFWPDGYYSGLYLPFPSEEELKKVSYVVLLHKVNNTEPERQIGDFYIYNVR